MKVLLTSFRHSKSLEDPKYSVARWQPDGFDYLALPFLAPFDPVTGANMLVKMDPDLFRRKYEQILENGAEQLDKFFEKCKDESVVFCCWCTMARQKTQEHLYCHTVLLGRYIEERYPDFEVEYLDGRSRDWFSDIYLGEE